MSSFDRILPIIYSLGRISIQEGDRQLGFSEHPPHLRSLIVGLLLPYHGGMPLLVTRDLKRGWIRLLASGRVNIDEMLGVIATMRATAEGRMIPMLVDARDAYGGFSDADVERAVAAVDDAARRSGVRGHVALVALDDAVFTGMLHYETRCAEIGVRVIRVFRLLADAEHWLEVVTDARDLH